jgi:hypothetical protein
MHPEVEFVIDAKPTDVNADPGGVMNSKYL